MDDHIIPLVWKRESPADSPHPSLRHTSIFSCPNRAPLPARTLYSGQRRGSQAAATAMRILHLALCKMRCASIQDAKRVGTE